MLRTTNAILFLAFCLSAQLAGQTSTSRLAASFSSPVFATSPPTDNERLFVLEKDRGRIQILDLASGEKADDEFLRVTGQSTSGERGLLGMAFHPDYADNGKFYVYSSQQGGSENHLSQVFEYTVMGDPATSSVADPDSRRSVLQFDQPFGNHNGGWIGFDPTATSAARNHLYIATGDGGSGGDPQNNSQDITNNLLGKILRIDVSGDDFANDELQNYSIPASNPFVNVSGDDEILAYGLRNPWRSSFDRASGDIWIGDVGQGELEEVDLIPHGTSGQNFGWRVMEGTDCFNDGDSRDGNPRCTDLSLVPPVHEYPHNFGSGGGLSITGGYVYHGSAKELEGQYFFADFVSNNIWTLDPDSGTVINRNAELRPDDGQLSSIASFSEDADGEMYIVSISGSLYRVDSESRDARWVGIDASSGEVGDGVDWSAAANWERDGIVDVAFRNGDHLVLAGDVSDLPSGQRFSAITFEQNASLQTAESATVESGNVFVNDGVTGSIAASGLSNRTNALRKLGPGHLNLDADAGSMELFLKEGTASLGRTYENKVVIEPDATLVHSSHVLGIGSLVGEEGTLDISPVSGGFVSTEPLLQVRDFEGQFQVAIPVDENGESLVSLLNPGERALVMLLSAENAGVVEVSAFNTGVEEIVWMPDDAGGGELVLNLLNPLAGDLDLDGTVDFADFLNMSSNFGQGFQFQFDHFLALRENFGKTAELVGLPTRNDVAAVPEPNAAGAALIGLVLGSLLVRRKRSDQGQALI